MLVVSEHESRGMSRKHLYARCIEGDEHHALAVIRVCIRISDAMTIATLHRDDIPPVTTTPRRL